jgi:putative membrane protein
MQSKESAVPLREDKLATEFLANERTFLAWIRTSIAVISLGFVVAKFGVWVRELSMHFGSHAPTAGTESSWFIGVAMMIFGGVLAILAARRYHVVNRAIESGRVSADRGLVYLVTSIVILLSVGMTLYLVMSQAPGEPRDQSSAFSKQ